METGAEGGKKNELYQYEAPWPIYGLGWCQRAGRPFRLAIGSFVEEYTNKVRCVYTRATPHLYSRRKQQIQIVELDQERGKFVHKSTADHPYPTTRILWMPETVSKQYPVRAVSILTDSAGEAGAGSLCDNGGLSANMEGFGGRQVHRHGVRPERRKGAVTAWSCTNPAFISYA